MKDEKNINADNLQLKHLNRNVILDFLQWLEYKHKNEVSTRNQRYTAIRSFCKYLQYKEPMRISEWQSIRSIKLKKGISGSFSYLSIDAIKLLLDQIPLNSRSSRRDLALIALLYDSGARAQEIADLTPASVRFDNPNTIRLVVKETNNELFRCKKNKQIF